MSHHDTDPTRDAGAQPDDQEVPACPACGHPGHLDPTRRRVHHPGRHWPCRWPDPTPAPTQAWPWPSSPYALLEAVAVLNPPRFEPPADPPPQSWRSRAVTRRPHPDDRTPP